MYQHDQARGHMAHATTGLLADHEVNVVEWPPKGADLSPVELCFGEMQRRAKAKYSTITTKDELWEYVCKLVFKKDFTAFVKKVYDGVPAKWE